MKLVGAAVTINVICLLHFRLYYIFCSVTCFVGYVFISVSDGSYFTFCVCKRGESFVAVVTLPCKIRVL
jgi:hypothetical protein